MDTDLKIALLQDMFFGSAVAAFFGVLAYECTKAGLAAREEEKSAVP